LDTKRTARRALLAIALSTACVPVVSSLLHAQPAPVGPAPTTKPTTQPMTPDHILVQVGDEKLTYADFEAFIADLPPREQAMARGPGRRELAEYLVRMKLLAQEAEKRKLDESEKVKRQLTLLRQQVLAGAMVNDVQQKVDDAAVKAYYEKNKQSLEKIAARHVLIRIPGSRVPLREGQKEMTEEQAKAKADSIVTRLKAGEDFGKIAMAESDDTGSGAEGGDLGSFGHGRMVPTFEQVAFALKEGEISAPVKTQFGWHVIQVTGRFDTPEKLADQIKGALGPQKMNDLINDLKKSSKVTYDEQYLGPAMPDPDAVPPGTQPGATPPPPTPK
jgi:peptidyl-prolyl cis-trans isomerase C